MLSLLVHPNDDIRSRRLTPAELKSPTAVLGVEDTEVIYMDASIAMWVDADYLNRPRDDFNACATFLARSYDFTFPSLRGPALLCALRDDGTIDNFPLTDAVRLYHRIHTLANQ